MGTTVSQQSAGDVQVKSLGDLHSIEDMISRGELAAKLGDNVIEIVMLPMFGGG